MALYDVFLKLEHSKRASGYLIRNNIRLLRWLKKLNPGVYTNILEIGPGKGYLSNACNLEGGFKYHAADRSKNILDNLGIDKELCFVTELPHLDGIKQKFDIIFVGYVVEHLKNGVELYETLQNLKGLLSDNGILVLTFPDSMALGMELYNIDYTHSLPTTKRNVNQALLDAGMRMDKCVSLCGIGYVPGVESKVLYHFKKTLLFFYSYKLMSFIAWPFYHVPLHSLNNIWWRAYALLKEPNVLVIARKAEK